MQRSATSLPYGADVPNETWGYPARRGYSSLLSRVAPQTAGGNACRRHALNNECVKKAQGMSIVNDTYTANPSSPSLKASNTTIPASKSFFDSKACSATYRRNSPSTSRAVLITVVPFPGRIFYCITEVDQKCRGGALGLSAVSDPGLLSYYLRKKLAIFKAMPPARLFSQPFFDWLSPVGRESSINQGLAKQNLIGSPR